MVVALDNSMHVHRGRFVVPIPLSSVLILPVRSHLIHAQSLIARRSDLQCLVLVVVVQLRTVSVRRVSRAL